LDGGRLFKAVLYQIALQESREGKFRETFHFDFADENRRADYQTEGEGVVDQLPVVSIIAQAKRPVVVWCRDPT
jgi:hypothetical protein